MINIALFMYFQTLDLMGLHLLLNNLEPPTKEALNTPSSRKQWIKKMCDYRPVVERIFGYFLTEKHDLESIPYSTRCTQAVQTARYDKPHVGMCPY